MEQRRENTSLKEMSLREQKRSLKAAKRANKDKNPKFMRSRMWFSTLVSKKFEDKLTIPQNLGNRMFVGNNLYMTKTYITKVFTDIVFSDETYTNMIQTMVEDIKSVVPGVLIDPIWKTAPFRPMLYDTTMMNKVNSWNRMLDKPNVNPRTSLMHQRASKQLLTRNILTNPEKVATKVYVSIIVRGETIRQVKEACDIIERTFDANRVSYRFVKSYLYDTLRKVLFSYGPGKYRKEASYNVLLTEDLLSTIPMIESTGRQDGVLFGIDVKTKQPRFVDLKSDSKAKNIYVLGRTGGFKTFSATAWAIDALYDDYHLFVRDVKGNEFTQLCSAVGGETISMSMKAKNYPNFFKLNPLTDEDAKEHYVKKVQLCKELLTIIASPKEEDLTIVETIIDDFLGKLYLSLGVVGDNRNTWYRSFPLTYSKVYDRLFKYIQGGILDEYPSIATNLLARVKMYLSEQGNFSYFCQEDIEVENLVDSTMLVFSFGINDNSQNFDKTLYRLKDLAMKYVSAEFSRRKFRLGISTIGILEESQYDNEFVDMSSYVEDVTLKRAQGRVNIVLGNAFLEDEKFKPMMANFTMFAIGPLTTSQRKAVCEEYGLEEHAETLRKIEKDPNYANSFLFVDKHDTNSLDAVLRIEVNEDYKNSEIFNFRKE